MEGVGVVDEKQQQQSSSSSSSSSSYTYWVRQSSFDAAPMPVPRKLSAEDLSKCRPLTSSPALGSVWNQAGTWEEKNLNTWANNRIKELITSLDSLEFPNGRAAISEVSKCVGDAFLVTVRNKKRVGYTYELTLRFRGEWFIQEERRKIKGYIDVPEFTFGELDELQIEIRLSEDKDLTAEDKRRVAADMKGFLPAIRERLLSFEQELKDR